MENYSLQVFYGPHSYSHEKRFKSVDGGCVSLDCIQHYYRGLQVYTPTTCHRRWVQLTIIHHRSIKLETLEFESPLFNPSKIHIIAIIIRLSHWKTPYTIVTPSHHPYPHELSPQFKNNYKLCKTFLRQHK